MTIFMNERILYFNIACFNVLLNSNDLSEIKRCELVVKECPSVLMNGVHCTWIDAKEEFKVLIA